jgi:hypothetical protein
MERKKDVCPLNTTHDEQMVPARVPGQDMEKPKVVTNYNTMVVDVDLCDAYLTSYRSIRKIVKKFSQNRFHHLVYICCLNSHLLPPPQKKLVTFPSWNFK